MTRFGVLLMAVLGWTTIAGCQGESQPPPLTAEQERQLKEQAQQVQQQEQAHFSQEAAKTPGANP